MAVSQPAGLFSSYTCMPSSPSLLARPLVGLTNFQWLERHNGDVESGLGVSSGGQKGAGRWTTVWKAPFPALLFCLLFSPGSFCLLPGGGGWQCESRSLHNIPGSALGSIGSSQAPQSSGWPHCWGILLSFRLSQRTVNK